MAYSIMNMGNSTKANAKNSLKTLADMEEKREAQNKSIKQQRKTSQLGGAAAGAAIGLQYGSSGGPWGAAIGAAVGFLAGSL